MKCRNCGTEIADKALICYRCGTATSEPRIQPPPARKGRGPLPLVAALVVIIAAAVAVTLQLPTGPERSVVWITAIILIGVATRILRPRRPTTRGR